MIKKLGAINFVRSLIQLLRGRPNISPSLNENPLLRVILNRRSVRSFSGKEIPEDVFAAVLEAGRLAPSTVNLQTWSFAVFDAGSWRSTFGRTIPFNGSRALIIIADTFRDRQVLDVFPYSPLVEHTVAVMNASLAAMNMNIAAEALGVASVMLSETGRSGLLDIRYLRETLHLPHGAIPIMTIVFGYPRGPYPPMPPKLPLEHIIFSDRYQAPDQTTMESWLNQMMAGYKVSHPRSSFQQQLNLYQKKIGQAEHDLHEVIFDQKKS